MVKKYLAREVRSRLEAEKKREKRVAKVFFRSYKLVEERSTVTTRPAYFLVYPVLHASEASNHL